MMLVAYPALFYYDASAQAKYFVTFQILKIALLKGKIFKTHLRWLQNTWGSLLLI